MRKTATDGPAGGEGVSPPYLQFVDQNSDGVEFIGEVRRVSHGGRPWREKERARLSQEIRESAS